jgi:hypothetical protein
MPRRVIGVEEAIAWVEALEREEDPRMLVVCDVRVWRPRDILSPRDGEWFEVALPAVYVKRYLAKGFKAENPKPGSVVEVFDWGDMAVAELRAHAITNDIDLTGLGRKADIVKAVMRG